MTTTTQTPKDAYYAKLDAAFAQLNAELLKEGKGAFKSEAAGIGKYRAYKKPMNGHSHTFADANRRSIASAIRRAEQAHGLPTLSIRIEEIRYERSGDFYAALAYKRLDS